MYNWIYLFHLPSYLKNEKNILSQKNILFRITKTTTI